MRKKLSLVFGSMAVALVLLAAKEQLGSPHARLTVRVFNEQGTPVQGAQVTFTFRDPNTRQGVPLVGSTDEKGEFSGEGVSGPSVGGQIQMNGHYPSGFPFVPYRDIKDGRWIPWNPTFETVIRPIGKPAQLCAKRVYSHVPVLDLPCGFDLEKGDWVAPYGKGSKPDFTFTVHRDYRAWMDFTADAAVSFSHPLDGIIGMATPAIGRYSQFRWERSAPDNGFNANHKIHIADSPPNSGKGFQKSFDNEDRYRGYFFRVRTVEQNGRIVSANYGKITGDIGIDPRDSKTCSISFTYYFNPTSLDRNLEWDTKRNLIPGLSYDETPREP